MKTISDRDPDGPDWVRYSLKEIQSIISQIFNSKNIYEFFKIYKHL